MIMESNRITDASLLFARVILGLVVAAHGAQKLLGWFDGYGFDGTVSFFTATIGLPYPFAVLIILTESFGMIALAFGLTSRLLAAAIVFIMIGAIVTVHGNFGFFMNWNGNLGGEGFEFHLLVIALAVLVVTNGPGRYSIDYYLSRKITRKNIFTKLILN